MESIDGRRSGAFQHRIVTLGVIALAGLIVFLRRPDALINPQFFAEDGVIFFLNAYEKGPIAILTPYGGYLHLVPRLIAWFALAFDPGWIPAIYNGASFAIWVAVAAALFSRRIALPAKPALVLAMVLVPHTGEVLISLYNANWPLALGLVLLLIAADTDTPGRRLFDHSVALFCGLSGPSSIFLLPVFAVRAFTRRTRESVSLLVTLVVVAAVQAFFMWQSRALFVRSTPIDIPQLLCAMGGRLYGTFFGGYGLSPFRPTWQWFAIAIGVTMLGCVALSQRSVYSKSERLLAGAWLCLALSVAIKFLREASEIAFPLNGDRYFFLPHVLLAWLLIVFIARTRGPARMVAVAAVVAALVTNVRYLRVGPLHDYAWVTHVQPIREGKEFWIPINPEGYSVSSLAKHAPR